MDFVEHERTIVDHVGSGLGATTWVEPKHPCPHTTVASSHGEPPDNVTSSLKSALLVKGLS